MRISDWSSDVCSSDLASRSRPRGAPTVAIACRSSHLCDERERQMSHREAEWRPRPAWHTRADRLAFDGACEPPATGFSVDHERRVFDLLIYLRADVGRINRADLDLLAGQNGAEDWKRGGEGKRG